MSKRLHRVGMVVGGIVLLLFLVSILTPGGRMRERARRVACQQNLRQIGYAMKAYAEENGGRLPMDSARPTLVGSFQLLTNMIAPQVLHCWSDDRWGSKPTTNLAALTTFNISYSYVPNQVWFTTGTPYIIVLDRIDATLAGIGWLRNGNHGAMGGNVLYNDGHVAWCNFLPSALTDKDGKEALLSP